MGVPEILPLVPASVSPEGRLPDETVHVNGWVPPLAARVAEYAVPVVPEPRLVVLMRRGSGAVPIFNVNSRVSIRAGVEESITRTENA